MKTTNIFTKSQSFPRADLVRSFTLSKDTKWLIQIMVSMASTFSLMELWRTLGFFYYDKSPISINSFLTPYYLLAVFLPFQIALKKIGYFQIILFIIYAYTTTIIIQFVLTDPGIISSTWYGIIAISFSAIYFLQKMSSLVNTHNQINNIPIAENNKFILLNLLENQCRFFLDKYLVLIIALGTTVGVMMSILWGDTHNAFRGTRGQKVTDSIYMVLGFFSVFSCTVYWIAIPIYKVYISLSQKILPIFEKNNL
jgi:hypothetical protein